MNLEDIPKTVSLFLGLDKYSRDRIMYFKESFESEIMPNDFTDEHNDILIKYHDYCCKDLVKFYSNKDFPMLMFMISQDGLRNALFHGGNPDLEKKIITLESISTPKACVASFNDQGNYFKDSEIKQYWENRIVPPNLNPPLLDSDGRKLTGNRIGTGRFYETSDIIFVDNLTGTLYLGFGQKPTYVESKKKK